MHTILIMVEPIVFVPAALVAAAGLCWALWQLCRLLRHPEMSALLILLLVLLALAGDLPRSGLLNMALAFALTAAVPMWIAGRRWRRRLAARAPLVRAGS